VAMDQVGFEPTSSRSRGEVTLTFTTSNFFAGDLPAPARITRWPATRAGQISPGGIVDQSCGTTAPHRVTDEVTLLRAIPASRPVGTIGPRSWFELLPLARQAGLLVPATLSGFRQSALLEK